MAVIVAERAVTYYSIDLPNNISITRIYTDMIDYLLVHTKATFENKNPNGIETWARLFPASDIIIAHPNGWSVSEQGVLRDAVAQTSWVPAMDLKSRLHFVPEGEASVHFCLSHSRLNSILTVSDPQPAPDIYLTSVVCSRVYSL